jgi:hypothetical protein
MSASRHSHLNMRRTGHTMPVMQPVATEFCFTARAELVATQTVGDISRGVQLFHVAEKRHE